MSDEKVTIWRKPSAAMLRPFMGCPDDELELAWEAMLHIAQAEQRVMGMAVVVDPSMPPDEMRFVQDGKVVGTITGIE